MSALVEDADDVAGADSLGVVSGEYSESSRPRIAAARKWIERQYMRPLTVTRIARHVGLPTIRLEREFGEVYGESPRELLLRCRMQEADRLLDAGRGVTEIALLVGYNTERLFLSDYRRWKARRRVG